jgi:hypothetical protein
LAHLQVYSRRILARALEASGFQSAARRTARLGGKGEAHMDLTARVPHPRGKTGAAKIAGFLGLFRFHPQSKWRGLLPASMLALLSVVVAAASTGSYVPLPPAPPESLSAAEFARLIRELSEEGGYFLSDNFTSNETSYLHVVDKLRQLGATGGAYIGVGPEQNFTYIAKVRPQLAFIVDIRRQAMIQHLMYKAVFHLAPTRAQFLARLLSRPLLKDKTPSPEATTSELLAFINQAPADDKTFAANLAEVRRVIQEEFQFPLAETDQRSLEYVYRSFRAEGLEISFRMDGSWSSYFPTLQEIITQTDLAGKPGNFLASAEDYGFVRELHRRNLIIPVVGDFAGRKALAAVGDYVRKQGLTVTAFYTSNVEQYLFDGAAFTAFAENVRKLPLGDRSLFIRAVFNMRYSHPAQLPGHLSTTLLQRMPVFLRDFDEGRYHSYRDLIMTNYIPAEKP